MQEVRVGNRYNIGLVLHENSQHSIVLFPNDPFISPLYVIIPQLEPTYPHSPCKTRRQKVKSIEKIARVRFEKKKE